MAKENYISLRGSLKSDVIFFRNENDEVYAAIFRLDTIGRDIHDRAGNLAPRFYQPIISIRDPILLRKLLNERTQLKKHDILDIKGIFHSSRSVRTFICPHCGHEFRKEVPLNTIYPTYVDSIAHFDSEKECRNYLMGCAEIANVAKAFGRVCTKTDSIYVGENDHGDLFCSYQLAVNRKLYIPGSVDQEDHADYPFVYSYGEVAMDDMHILQQNTLVYLDGYVRTSNCKERMICESCGGEFSYDTQRMVLSPYSMEYLRDYVELNPATHPSKSEANTDTETDTNSADAAS